MNLMKTAYRLLRDTVTGWSEDEAPQMAAAMAFYTIFSLGPVLVIAISIAGFFFSDESVRGRVIAQFSDLLGPEGAKQIDTVIKNATVPSQGVVATAISLAMFLVAATAAFGHLKRSLNSIWDADPKHGAFFKWMKTRALALALVLMIGFLLLTSLVVSAAISSLHDHAEEYVHTPAFVLQAANIGVSFGVITLLFAMIYKLLPDARVAWKDVWIGAAITSVLFALGKYGIGLYLGRTTAASVYGAAGSVVIVLLWVYYSSMILFFGAEFTHAYSKLRKARGRA